MILVQQKNSAPSPWKRLATYANITNVDKKSCATNPHL